MLDSIFSLLQISFTLIWVVGSAFMLGALVLTAIVCGRLAWQGNHYLYVHWTVSSCLGIYATLHVIISTGLFS